MMILMGVIGLVALLSMFLVGLGRAIRAGDGRVLRRAVGALIGQAVLGLVAVPAVVGLTHYLSELTSTT